jgi:hypothetical protein
VYREGFYSMGPEDEAREWRNGILQVLSTHGTEQAVVTLAELSRQHPERLIITSNLLRARSSVFASAWSPPLPDELAALFEDASRRLVRSEGELADLVLEVLAAISRDLPGHGELLWDRLPKRVLPEDSGLKDAWLPKPEAALSAYVAHELSIRIDRRGLAVNREVLVLPTDAYGAGDRTDILVQATMRHDQFRGSTPDRLAVVIEVKGPWNEDLMTDQRQQLAQRYLPEAQTSNGIYLVGWYPLDLWTDEKDYRRSRVARFDRSQLLADLQTQAISIRVDLSMRTTPPLARRSPTPQSRRRRRECSDIACAVATASMSTRGPKWQVRSSFPHSTCLGMTADSNEKRVRSREKGQRPPRTAPNVSSVSDPTSVRHWR